MRDLATAKGLKFLFESTVMGGTPIFSLFRGSLPATTMTRFRGMFNSTSSVILGQMELGLSFDDGVRKAQELGIAHGFVSRFLEALEGQGFVRLTRRGNRRHVVKESKLLEAVAATPAGPRR